MGELVGGATDRSIGIWDGRHNKLRAATAPGDYFVSAEIQLMDCLMVMREFL